MTVRALTARVHNLGAAVGLVGLSAHDLRHFWATRAARNGTPLDRLAGRRRLGLAGDTCIPGIAGYGCRRSAGASVPLRYVETAKIANQGVLLGERP
jgi:hypothetical protein